MSEQEAIEAQQQLVEERLDLVFATYDEAIADGVEAPVLMLVDCEDELGSQIARGWLGDEQIDEAIAVHRADSGGEPGGGATAFARGVPWKESRAELSEAFPYLADALQSPPPSDGVLVISITAGGASALTAPFSAR